MTRFLSVWCLLALLSSHAQAQTPQAKLWDRSAALYSKTQTLQIRVETVFWMDKAPRKREKVTATTFYERPNRWRFQSEAPLRIHLVADGKTLFLADERERYSGAQYAPKLQLNTSGANDPFISMLSYLLRNALLFSDPGLKVVSLGERVLEGSKLSGLRVSGDLQKGVPETTLWFASDGSLKRAQMRARFDKQIINIQTRATSQRRNETLPPDTFGAPSPFKSDVFEPQATELLSRAAKFYGGLKSLKMRIVTRDFTPDSKFKKNASLGGVSTLEFGRPSRLRLSWAPQKIELMTNSFRGLIRDGKTLWEQNQYDESQSPDDWSRTQLTDDNRGDFEKNWLGHTTFLGIGSGDVVCRLLQGRSPAPQESEREHDVSAFEVRFLGVHPRERSWQGVRIREWNQRLAASIDERVLWFDVSDSQKPQLKQVRYRSDQKDDIYPEEKTEESVGQSEFDPILPAARFRPVPDSRVSDAN